MLLPEADAEVARKGRRALPAIDREEVHRARAVAAWQARHGQHRSRHGGAGRTDEAGRIHPGRRSSSSMRPRRMAGTASNMCGCEPSGQAPNQGLAGLAKPFDNSHTVYCKG